MQTPFNKPILEVYMNSLALVQKALDDIEKGSVDASDYTDDMTFTGPMPKPLSRDEYLGLMNAIVCASPDWKFNSRDFALENDTVHITVGITGTQTNTLQPIMPGMSALLPTNKRFTLPEEHLEISVRGGKVRSIHAYVPPNGGIPGMLAQLGAPLPG
jgi:hypothetical protein